MLYPATLYVSDNPECLYTSNEKEVYHILTLATMYKHWRNQSGLQLLAPRKAYLQVNTIPGCLPIDLFRTRHKMVHNGGSPNFKESLFDKRRTYMAQILQSLSYKVCFIILPKFNSFGLFILILGKSAIMDQTACCYNITTSEIGLFPV